MSLDTPPKVSRFQSVIDAMAADPKIADEHLQVRRVSGREATFGALEPALPEALTQALGKRNIEQLYTHQAEAISHVRAGRNTAWRVSYRSQFACSRRPWPCRRRYKPVSGYGVRI